MHSDGFASVERAAHKCADRLANWLIAELSKGDSPESDEDGEVENPYRLGGEMKFLPAHQGGGFTGEFTKEEWFIPLDWDVTDSTDPTVRNAVVRAFAAGARWQKRKSRRAIQPQQ